MSNGSTATASDKPDDEDIWVCKRCGWTYPNHHPSARHRRNHRKNCGKVKGFEAVKPAEQDHGSSDDVSSGDEQHHQQQEIATVQETHQAIAPDDNVEDKESTSIVPSSTVPATEELPVEGVSHLEQEPAVSSGEQWEQLLDQVVSQSPKHLPLGPGNSSNGNWVEESSNEPLTAGLNDETPAVNPFASNSQPAYGEHADIQVPMESTQSTQKNPFLQIDNVEKATQAPALTTEAPRLGKAEASSSASWESIKPHVPLKALFDEDRTKRVERNLLNQETPSVIPPPKRTNSNVLMSVLETVRSSPAKFGGRNSERQKRRSWWNSYMCCTSPSVS